MEDRGALVSLLPQSRDLRVECEVPRAELLQFIGRVQKKLAHKPLIVISVMNTVVSLYVGGRPGKLLHNMLAP